MIFFVLNSIKQSIWHEQSLFNCIILQVQWYLSLALMGLTLIQIKKGFKKRESVSHALQGGSAGILYAFKTFHISHYPSTQKHAQIHKAMQISTSAFSTSVYIYRLMLRGKHSPLF